MLLRDRKTQEGRSAALLRPPKGILRPSPLGPSCAARLMPLQIRHGRSFGCRTREGEGQSWKKGGSGRNCRMFTNSVSGSPARLSGLYGGRFFPPCPGPRSVPWRLRVAQDRGLSRQRKRAKEGAVLAIWTTPKACQPPDRRCVSGRAAQVASFAAVSGVACRVSLRSPRHPTLTLGS